MDKLNSKNYTKKSMVSMTFGSIMNGIQGTLGENWEEETKKAWELATKLTGDYIDELYEEEGSQGKPL